MFGLSLSAIVTIVKPIIGILNDAASLFQKGREIWKDLRQANRSDDVQSLVSTSGNQVQQEYDVGLRYMGGAFAEGDDIVRKALNQHQNTFKYEVFPLLTLDPSYDAAAVVLRVATHTAAARDRSIAALHDFGQRLMQKAPIKRGPAPPRPATLRAERYGQRATGHQPSGYAFHSSTPVAPTRGNATAAPRYDEPSVGNVSSNVDVRDRQEEAQPGTRNPGLSEGTLSRRVPTLEQRNAGYNCFQQLTWRAARR
nr:hypothetical protein B0A51_09779 [Rachicladosporium sp. CCFEE 5018]